MPENNASENLSSGKCFGIIFNPCRTDLPIYMREITAKQTGARLGTNMYAQLLTAPELPPRPAAQPTSTAKI